MHIVLIIPARFESSRLPGKPLSMISGESMIRRTYNQCKEGFPEKDIYVATDDPRIKTHCEEVGIKVIMTSTDPLTGTDRIAEAVKDLAADYIINVQGDEPLCNPEDIRVLHREATKFPDKILNGYSAITNEIDYRSRSIPKVVFRPDGRLLYMSRSAVPGSKDDRFRIAYRQVCIYGFPSERLKDFAAKTVKGQLEAEEDIEILRFLEMGQEVHMLKMSDESIAVDFPEDIVRVERAIKNRKDVK